MADCRMIPRLLDHLCLKSKLCVLTRGLERERHPQLSSCRTFPGLHPDRYVSTMPAQKLNYLRPPRQTWDDTFSGYSQTAGGHGESDGILQTGAGGQRDCQPGVEGITGACGINSLHLNRRDMDRRRCG